MLRAEGQRTVMDTGAGVEPPTEPGCRGGNGDWGPGMQKIRMAGGRPGSASGSNQFP